MKLSSISILGSLFALASAGYHTQEVAVVCTDPAPITVTQTITVYGGNKHQVPPTYTASYASASTLPSHIKKIHNVIVGINGDLKYGGNQIDAAVGDIIRFDFNSTNHTVTQSDFNTPCSPKAGGFNTGFNQFNPTNHTGVKLVDFEVKVSSPLWFYCAQTVKASHCRKGMVLGVNPAGKFPAFLSMATATATSIIAPSGTGNVKNVSTSASGKPYSPSTSGFWSTGCYVKSTGGIYIPKSTPVAYKIKGRRAAEWYN